MPKIDIQPIKSDDELKQLSVFAAKIWHEAYADMISKQQIDYMLAKFQSPKAFGEQIAQGYRYYLMIMDGQWVAYSAAIPAENGRMFLSKLYVASEFRRQGCARRFVAFWVKECRTCGLVGIELTVNRYNERALKFYQEYGFQIEDQKCVDIGNGFVMDDYVMCLSLN